LNKSIESVKKPSVSSISVLFDSIAMKRRHFVFNKTTKRRHL